jgi:hypothetical protein
MITFHNNNIISHWNLFIWYSKCWCSWAFHFLNYLKIEPFLSFPQPSSLIVGLTSWILPAQSEIDDGLCHLGTETSPLPPPRPKQRRVTIIKKLNPVLSYIHPSTRVCNNVFDVLNNVWSLKLPWKLITIWVYKFNVSLWFPVSKRCILKFTLK